MTLAYVTVVLTVTAATLCAYALLAVLRPVEAGIVAFGLGVAFRDEVWPRLEGLR